MSTQSENELLQRFIDERCAVLVAADANGKDLYSFSFRNGQDNQIFDLLHRRGYIHRYERSATHIIFELLDKYQINYDSTGSFTATEAEMCGV